MIKLTNLTIFEQSRKWGEINFCWFFSLQALYPIAYPFREKSTAHVVARLVKCYDMRLILVCLIFINSAQASQMKSLCFLDPWYSWNERQILDFTFDFKVAAQPLWLCVRKDDTVPARPHKIQCHLYHNCNRHAFDYYIKKFYF